MVINPANMNIKITYKHCWNGLRLWPQRLQTL